MYVYKYCLSHAVFIVFTHNNLFLASINTKVYDNNSINGKVVSTNDTDTTSSGVSNPNFTRESIRHAYMDKIKQTTKTPLTGKRETIKLGELQQSLGRRLIQDEIPHRIIKESVKKKLNLSGTDKKFKVMSAKTQAKNTKRKYKLLDTDKNALQDID
jgi:hypothetical protein